MEHICAGEKAGRDSVKRARLAAGDYGTTSESGIVQLLTIDFVSFLHRQLDEESFALF